MSYPCIYDRIINLYDSRGETYTYGDGSEGTITVYRSPNEYDIYIYVEEPVIKCMECYEKNYTHNSYSCATCFQCGASLDNNFLNELEMKRLIFGEFNIKEYKPIKPRFDRNESGICSMDIELSNGNKKFIIYYGYIEFPIMIVDSHVVHEHFFIFNNMQNRDKNYKNPKKIITMIDPGKDWEYPKHNKDDLSMG